MGLVNRTFKGKQQPKHKRRFPSLAQFEAGRKSQVPEGGWMDEDLASANGRELVNDIVNVARFSAGRGVASLMSELVKELEVQVDEVVEVFRRMAGLPSKGMINLTELGTEHLWGQAIEQTLNTHTGRTSMLLRPRVQSVMAEVFDKTSRLMGFKPLTGHTAGLNPRLVKRLRDAAVVSETTRKQMVTEARRFLKETNGPEQFKGRMRARLAARAAVIARTEMGRAVDEGVKHALVSSGIVAAVSVVGCQAVEPGIPTFDGRPTCLIKQVPIGRADELVFHPQHSGCIVPSKLFKRDGTL